MSFQTDSNRWLKGHTVLTEFVELRTLRLDRGWTYRTLAEKINKVSPTRISYSSLHGLLNDPTQTPNELTLHGIREFLKSPLARARRQKRKAA
jgi:transcriptional regulator with XRE-family HTH domain